MNSQSPETVKMASKSHNSTFHTGFALSASLYHKNTVIRLSGELGVGKTTFVQGLGQGLGLSRVLTSPTYALENRYGSTDSPLTDNVLMHLDLYRLDTEEAKRIAEESEDFPGVRAIEWSERLECKEGSEGYLPSLPSLHINLKETSPTTREITIIFADIPLPSREEIEAWRREVQLPEHIGRHCDAVGAFAQKCAEELLQRGTICRPETVRIAGELHDLLRFVDFKKSVHKKIPHAKEPDEQTQKHWGTLREMYGEKHEDACAAFLEKQKYPEIAMIIRSHGLRSADHPDHFRTIEQKILYYADKRVQYDKVVSLDERFDDFVERYGDGKESDWAKMTREKTKSMEKELFGKNVPTP
jgi:tRNA threonylcarbamoyladenosine biosynthesis protein TsaE